MYFIRKATLDDVETIREIAEKTWRHTYLPILEKEQLDYMLTEIYSSEKISSQLKYDTQTYLLLTENERPVAFAAYSPREEDPEIYKLHKLYCLPETLEAGKHTLDLNVNRHNKAKNFYEKMGFVVAYEEDIPIGKYWMNDYVMRKELIS